MLLAIDIGNTNVTLGVFRSGGKKPSAVWRLDTDRSLTAGRYGAKILAQFRRAGLAPHAVEGVIVASVVPPLDPVFNRLSRRFFRRRALFVGPGMKTGVKVLYDNPAEVGADRIVNAAAAFEMVRKACIVVDFGTATTFDCVNRRGDYLGGVIAPGPHTAAEALAQRTAKLPLLREFRKPKRAIGKTTLKSMASGFFYGYLGLTREIVARLQDEMGGRPAVLATGGLAGLLAPHVEAIQSVHPDLTLEGLRLLWERNAPRA